MKSAAKMAKGKVIPFNMDFVTTGVVEIQPCDVPAT